MIYFKVIFTSRPAIEFYLIGVIKNYFKSLFEKQEIRLNYMHFIKLHRYPVDISGNVVGESLDCLLLSETVVGENPDHVCWVRIPTVFSINKCS